MPNFNEVGILLSPEGDFCLEVLLQSKSAPFVRFSLDMLVLQCRVAVVKDSNNCSAFLQNAHRGLV